MALYQILQRKQFHPCLIYVRRHLAKLLCIYALSDFYPSWIDEVVFNLGSLLQNQINLRFFGLGLY